MEYLISAMNKLKLKPKEWNNIYKRNINLEKETYTRDEVIEILNKHDEELYLKHMYYISMIEEHYKHNMNKIHVLNWIQ